MNTFITILILLGLMILAIIFVYNSFIQLINHTNEAWADIDVQLRRRYDLIPNLIDLVKVYAKHEKAVFENVTEARAKALKANTVYDKEIADNMVKAALGKLIAIAEDYPKLRASENFSKLQDELTDTENIIASARRFYNGNVRDLNIRIETFPNNLIAKLFNFQKRDYFQIDQQAIKQEINVKN